MVFFIFVCFPSWAEESTIVSDEDSYEYIRGNHPRESGIWLQYFPLTTALRGNVFISDVITPKSQFEKWDGENTVLHDLDDETAENYDDSHNHYQNLLSEVINFSKGTNAVSIWGDSSAVVDGSKAWGGFLSARSNRDLFIENEEFKQYIPEGVVLSPDEMYDAQLIGLEVDVLNGGLPGVYPNMSKTGVQIVGFGNPNSMAIEVRSEDTDKDISGDERRGVFESGIYFKNSIAPYGRLIVSDFSTAKMGLDFRNTLFNEGAIVLNSNQVGTGIIFNEGKSGEIYGGERWSGQTEDNGWLTLRIGEKGIRVVSNDNTKELFAIDNEGNILTNPSGAAVQNTTNNNPYLLYITIILAIISVCLCLCIIYLFRKIRTIEMRF